METKYLLTIIHFLLGFIGYLIMKTKSTHFNNFSEFEQKYVLPIVYIIIGAFSFITSIIHWIIYIRDKKS